MTSHVLSWITFIPLIGMTAILMVPKQNMNLVKGIAAFATFIPLVLATQIYFGSFNKLDAAYQLVEQYEWIPMINVQYYVGIDGISLPLL